MIFSNFIQKLQSADESSKKRWLVILTVALLGTIIFIWLTFFNELSPVFGFVNYGGEGAGDISFWAHLKGGLASMFGTLSGGISSLGEILKTPREYIITPQ